MRVLLMTFFLIGMLGACAARVVDSASPDFDRRAFGYDDYKAYKKSRTGYRPPPGHYICMEYFPNLLPRGLSRAEVDSILQGAYVSPKDGGIVRYTYVEKQFWAHTITHIYVRYDDLQTTNTVTCTEGYKSL